MLLLFFVVSLFFPKSADALVKFNTEFQNYYRVNSDGSTHVSFVINQTNNLSAVYATDFGLNINETKISNVKVTDEGVIIIPEVVKTLNQTTISFSFANKVVGKNKTHSFIIEYDTTDIATKFGSTWQINIPRLESDENISNQVIILTVPDTFPAPAYIDPKPDTINGNKYYFTGSKLANKTISAVFGQTQYYKGTLAYHLTNEAATKSVTKIALPPDTAYQSVYYEKLIPMPESISVDEDGNYLAQYNLEPKSNLDINLTFGVRLNFLPKPTQTYPSEKYLVSNDTWNYNNGAFAAPEIKNLVSAKTIYDYVVDKMKYDYEKVNRQKSQKTPAAESLINNQSAICTDFTNVFVSLARKAGIPSRELEGYAISENPDLKPLSLTQDVLHSWPEYFNKANNTWTQIDPTWANTTRGIDYFNKLDFNHIVFVIHGLNPDYPVPAGGYKNGSSNSKDINIIPTETLTFPEPKFSLKILKQKKNIIVLQINNQTGTSYSGKAAVSENEYFETTEQNVNVPPFGSSEMEMKLKKVPFLGKIDSKVIININGQRYEQNITIEPTIPQVAIYTIIGVLLGFIAFIARHLYLRRSKQKASIYR